MRKRAWLTILEGSFEQGFPVILQISSGKNQKEIEIQVTGKLPPTPELWSTWQHWQQTYCQLLGLKTRIKAKPGQITNISDRELGAQFSILLNQWLNQGTEQWQPIRDCLHRNVAPNDELEIIIQTNDPQLQQIPWHLWDFFTYYVHAEIAISTCKYQAVKSLPSQTQARVKILAILGHDRDLDIDTDRAYLEQLLPQAPFVTT